jgi:dipeptidyl aminopeptidase/acylaminoacyl peptidase
MRRLVGITITAASLLVSGVAGTAAQSDRASPDVLGSVAPGSGPVRLVDQRAIEIPDTHLISLSPDGRWIAATRGLVDELCTYAVATLEQRSCADLAPLNAGIRLDDLAWSPDGTQIAFGEEAFMLGADGDLWLMDALTGALTNLDDDGFEGSLLRGPEDGTITIPATPTFTPDGEAVTFSRSLIVNGESAGNEIATVRVGGGVPERLTLVTPDELGVVYFGMRWAADGSRLYYSVHHRRPDDPDNGIWVVRADGGGDSQLVGRTDPDGGAPGVVQVSSKGDRLLAIDPITLRMRPNRAPLFTLIDPSARTWQPVTAPDSDVAALVSSAVLSPDGSKLLMVTHDESSGVQLHVRDLETGVDSTLAPDGIPYRPRPGLVPTWAITGAVLLTGQAGTREASGDLLALSQGLLLVLDGGGGRADDLLSLGEVADN